MIRFQGAGAPLTGKDAEVGPEDWGGEFVSQKRFRGEVQDLLIGHPDIFQTQRRHERSSRICIAQRLSAVHAKTPVSGVRFRAG